MRKLALLFVVLSLFALPAVALAASPDNDCTISPTETPNLDGKDYCHLAQTTKAERDSLSGFAGGDGGLCITKRNGTVDCVLSGERITTMPAGALDAKIDSAANRIGWDIALVCDVRSTLTGCTWYVGKDLTIPYLEAGSVSDTL